jgi:hypothetical protein
VQLLRDSGNDAMGGQNAKYSREQMLSALLPNSDIARCVRHFVFVPIVLQKSQTALRLIFRQRAKPATIADQCGLKPVTGIACEFGAWRRGPHIIFQSPRLRPGEFESRLAKRLLQHYLPRADIS